MRRLLFLAAVLALSGCALLVNYTVINWQVKWRLDDYVSWNVLQQQEFEAAILDTLRWHKTTQLDEYREFLLTLKNLQRPLSESQAMDLYVRGELLGRNIMEYALPHTVVMLRDISDAQVRDILDEVDEQTAEWQKDYGEMSADEWQQDRLERTEKSLRRFIGKLDEPQRAKLADWAVQFRDIREDWFAQRRVWRDNFAVALAGREQAQFDDRMAQLMVRVDELQSRDYREYWQSATRSTIALMAEIYNSMSEKQQREYQQSLDKYLGYVERLQNSSVPD